MNGSITNWLAAYKAGDRAGAQVLWTRYYERLVRLARTRLSGTSSTVRDEEDIALSAFHAFCAGLEAGRFPNLCDRDELWHLLADITIKKAIGAHRYESCDKRLSPASNSGVPLSIDDIAEIAGREPTPEFCALAIESLSELLQQLNDGQLSEIAIWKMEGYSNAEIAGRLGCSASTVERKLRRIRHEWSHLSEPGNHGE